jgi:AbrB family looped-hinge helix DNA binding protein
MIQSGITQKGQTTIPIEIRQALNLNPGDKVNYEIRDQEVLIRKIDPLDLMYHRSLNQSLGEWLSKEDDDAYGDL